MTTTSMSCSSTPWCSSHNQARHDKIFEVWDSLDVGDEIQLTNDHDPRPLHYQFMMEHEGEFEWESEERGPREWVATIRKVGLPKSE